MRYADPRMRMAIAQASDYPGELIVSCSIYMEAIQSKLGPSRITSEPPTDTVAMFLSLSDWPTLQDILNKIVARRTPTGASYGWFVQHALREIYGEEL